jgi:lipopolysaccharide biosynthesis glycosyltransferase
MIVPADVIHVFIGYDSRQTVLFNIAQHSIIRHCSQPVSITPIKLSHLKGIFERERLAIQSTEFSFSRFLTPYLMNYQGWALFMDCDIIARGDLSKLWASRDDRYAVQCVKHDHQPNNTVKFLGEQQTSYQKKNWSSVMLMNCAKCNALTPNYVNTASGLELHQFKWLESDDLIGELPREWNFLVDYYKHDDAAQLLHYTDGGPYYAASRHVDFAEEWFENYRDANGSADSTYLTLSEAARESAEGMADST